MTESRRDGWTLRSHAMVLEQLEEWTTRAEADRAKAEAAGSPDSFRNKPAFKLAMTLRKLMLTDIPSDPLDAKYRHGGTAKIGLEWFRAKFGAGRYRLFFRARRDKGLILYVWVNSERTLRTYGSKSDAYAVFATMLGTKAVPETWDELEAAISAKDDERFAAYASSGIS